MNILLWILQILLAIHTAIGAIWKFSNSEQSVPSLSAIPHAVWIALILVEFLCCLTLILPIFNKRYGNWAPVAAVCIAAEMVFFSIVHIFSGESNNNPMIYWLVVTAVCAFIAYGRFVLKPINNLQK